MALIASASNSIWRGFSYFCCFLLSSFSSSDFITRPTTADTAAARSSHHVFELISSVVGHSEWPMLSRATSARAPVRCIRLACIVRKMRKPIDFSSLRALAAYVRWRQNVVLLGCCSVPCCENEIISRSELRLAPNALQGCRDNALLIKRHFANAMKRLRIIEVVILQSLVD